MIDKIIENNNSNKFWMLFHVMLGLITTLSNWYLIIWVYFIIIFSLNRVLSSLLLRGTIHHFIPLIVYVCSFEVLGRILKSYPYIPWEISKYLITIRSIVLILIGGIKKPHFLGFVILMLIIPGILIDKSNMVVTEDVIFSTFGIICLAFLVIIIGGLKVNFLYLNSIVKLIWLSSVSLLINVMVKTPDLDSLTFSLNVDFSATGGFGSNQVTTVIGIGMFLSFYAWMNKLCFSGNHTVDGLFIGLFAYQGFLSFSRGGMIIGILAILVYYLMFRRSKSFQVIIKLRGLRPLFFFSFAVAILLLTYGLIENLSDGNLSLRYLGETESTINQAREKTINIVTTGRYDLLISDLKLWIDNFVFGVGSGASGYLKVDNFRGSATHTEFSRLLCEHGLFGLVIIILLLWQLVKTYQISRHNINGALLFVLCFIAIGTSMHSAMRTFVTPLFFALSSLIPLENEN